MFKRRQMTSFLLISLLFLSLAEAKEMALVKPETVGMSSQKLAAITQIVKESIQQKKIAGAVTMIARKGKIVYFDAYGMRDIAEKSPLKKDAIVRIYSMTKPITTVAAMMLYEKGKLKLDDKVSKYLPEFKKVKVFQHGKQVKAKREMTIRDLMRHTSGLTYGFFGNTPVDQMYKKDNPLSSKNNRSMAKKVASMPLLAQPGTQWIYSVSTDVLGAVVEKVSGQKLGKFFERYILKPLDMKDTAFAVAKSKVKRFSSNFGPGQRTTQKYNSKHNPFLSPQFIQSGGGGLTSTARDYMRFCQMLINKGEFEGRRYLKSKTVAEMTKNQLPKGVSCYGQGFGLGFKVETTGRYTGQYGWDGAASTYFWINPKKDLCVVILTQLMPFSTELREKLRPVIHGALK